MSVYCKNTKHEFFLPSIKAEPNLYIEVHDSGVYDSICFVIDSKDFHEEVWLHVCEDEWPAFTEKVWTLLNDRE